MHPLANYMSQQLAKTPHDATVTEAIADIAAATEGYSGADVVSLCREAILQGLNESFTIESESICCSGMLGLCSYTCSSRVVSAPL